MTLLADGLLIAGALAAAIYCWVLSSRVRSLKDLDTGLGAAIAGLSDKVDAMQDTLRKTQAATHAPTAHMAELADRAERLSEELSGLLDQGDAVVEAKHTEAAEVPTAPPAAAPLVARRNLEVVPEDPADTEPPVEKPAENDTTLLSAAERLQKEIRDKLANRTSDGNSEDIVRTIQTLLAAGR